MIANKTLYIRDQDLIYAFDIVANDPVIFATLQFRSGRDLCIENALRDSFHSAFFLWVGVIDTGANFGSLLENRVDGLEFLRRNLDDLAIVRHQTVDLASTSVVCV